jgi:hypothetical protein
LFPFVTFISGSLSKYNQRPAFYLTSFKLFIYIRLKTRPTSANEGLHNIELREPSVEIVLFDFNFINLNKTKMDSASAKTNWTSVITYYIIACGFSWPFFAWRDLYPENWAHSTVPAALRNLGVMWGPGVAALICFFLFRKTHVRTITFSGSSIIRSLLFFLLPYVI